MGGASATFRRILTQRRYGFQRFGCSTLRLATRRDESYHITVTPLRVAQACMRDDLVSLLRRQASPQCWTCSRLERRTRTPLARQHRLTLVGFIERELVSLYRSCALVGQSSAAGRLRCSRGVTARRSSLLGRPYGAAICSTGSYPSAEHIRGAAGFASPRDVVARAGKRICARTQRTGSPAPVRLSLK